MPKLRVTLTRSWNKRTKKIGVLDNGNELGQFTMAKRQNLMLQPEVIKSA